MSRLPCKSYEASLYQKIRTHQYLHQGVSWAENLPPHVACFVMSSMMLHHPKVQRCRNQFSESLISLLSKNRLNFAFAWSRLSFECSQGIYPLDKQPNILHSSCNCQTQPHPWQKPWQVLVYPFPPALGEACSGVRLLQM